MISAKKPAGGAATEARPTLIDLDAVIESAQTLEPLPASVARLAALVADDEADIREIVEVISFDQALTGNLLRRANSAAAAGRNPIRTVHEAVVRLGTGTVLALAMSASIGKRMGKAIPEYGMAEGQLWEHSVRVALAAETVRSAAKVPIPPEVATAGLLHDIGKLVLARFLGAGVLDLLKAAQEMDDLSPLEAEQAVLEVHHGELGGLIAQHWRLPETIVKGITYHHTPEAALEPICFAVHLANDIADELLGEDAEVERLHEEARARRLDARARSMKELGIPDSVYPTLCQTVGARYRDLRERYL